MTFTKCQNVFYSRGKMSNCSQKNENQKNKKISENSLNDFLNEESKFLKEIFLKSANDRLDNIDEKIENIKIPRLSRRFKLKMNRLFREQVGGSFLPYPEVDNIFERTRSNLIIKFKINRFVDNSKKRK